MKFLFILLLAAGVLVAIFGSPLAGSLPVKANYYESPEPILPMSFAHLDHVPVNCVTCHHNYTDDTGGGLCMTCHVTDASVWPLFEQQFHDLCRGCHEEKAALGEAGGPPRQCMECHGGDDIP